jgi:hypothetical protein
VKYLTINKIDYEKLDNFFHAMPLYAKAMASTATSKLETEAGHDQMPRSRIVLIFSLFISQNIFLAKRRL